MKIWILYEFSGFVDEFEELLIYLFLLKRITLLIFWNIKD